MATVRTETPKPPVLTEAQKKMLAEQESKWQGQKSLNPADDKAVILGWNATAIGAPAFPVYKKGSEAKDEFRNGLYGNDTKVWETVGKLYAMGIIKGTPGTTKFLDSAVSSYNKLVDLAAGSRSQSLMDIASIRAGSADGTGTGTGKSTYKTYTTYTDKQATDLAKDTYELYLGRQATSKEIADFKTALNRAAKAAPSVQLSNTSKKGVTTQNSTKGFDEASWVTGYISARIGLDKIDETAGKIGTTNDEFEKYEELYGYKPTKAMRLQDTQNVLQGKTTLEAVEARYRDQAKAL